MKKQVISQEQKDSLYKEVMVELSNSPVADMDGQCMYIAILAQRVLEKHGIKTSIEAGDATWLITDYDNGRNMTHYGYIWNTAREDGVVPDPAKMPECHVWLRDSVKRDKIIDFSLESVKRHMVSQGFKWVAEYNPEYLWGREPKKWRYTPKQECMNAIQWRIDKAKRVIDGEEKLNPSEMGYSVIETDNIYKKKGMEIIYV